MPIMTGRLEAMELDGAPRLAAHLQGGPVQLIAQLEWHHEIVFGVNYHHRLVERADVAVRFEAQVVVVHRLRDQQVEPGQVPEEPRERMLSHLVPDV